MCKIRKLVQKIFKIRRFAEKSANLQHWINDDSFSKQCNLQQNSTLSEEFIFKFQFLFNSNYGFIQSK